MRKSIKNDLSRPANWRGQIKGLLKKRADAELEVPIGLLDCVYERVPLQQEIVMDINEALSETDPQARQRKKSEAKKKLAQFHRMNGAGHSTPTWIRPTMDFCFNNLLGDRALAEARGLQALEAAKAPWQLAISNANLCQLFRRTNRHVQAIEYGCRAVELDPRNDGFWADLTLALLDGGESRAAREILNKVSRMTDLHSRKSIWRAHLIGYKDDFIRFSDLPEIRQLYDIISNRIKD